MHVCGCVCERARFRKSSTSSQHPLPAGVGFSRVLNGSRSLEPYVNLAKQGAGQLQGSYRNSWATYTSTDILDDMLFLTAPYSAPQSARPWGAW